MREDEHPVQTHGSVRNRAVGLDLEHNVRVVADKGYAFRRCRVVGICPERSAMLRTQQSHP